MKMLCSILHSTRGKARVLGEEIPDGNVVSSIGYMPQETGVYMGLTVDQNLKFYGRVFNLDKEEMEKKRG
nr:hypothetical protein [Methanobacterium formicicum]